MVQPFTEVHYTYDDAGNRATMTDPLLRTITYTPDALNRLDRLTIPGIGDVDPQYDVLSRRQRLTFPNGTQTTYQYTPASELDILDTRDPLTNPLVFQDFTYDLAGNRQALTDRAGDHTFVYDPLHRLTEARYGSPQQEEQHTYDPVGNKSTRATTWTFNAANRLTFDGLWPYTYDANGNLATWTGTAGVWTYTWDAQDQLLQIDRAASGTVTYAYDALGRRIQKDVTGTRTRFVYDQEDRLLDYAYDGSTHTPQARYTHGPGIDAPWLLEWDQNGNGTFEPTTEVWTYHTDALGSVVTLTDVNGQETQSYTYETFGRLVPGGPLPIPNPFRFTAREFDPETGLLYYRARYYDPSIGRFLSEDPIGLDGGDINLYAYVFNNPLSWVDPYGLNVMLTGPQRPTGFDVAPPGVPGHIDPIPEPLESPIGDPRNEPVDGDVDGTGFDVLPPSIGKLCSEPTEGSGKTPTGSSENTKNKRPSTEDKHKIGQARKDTDRGKKERGDKRRKNPRKRFGGKRYQ